MTNEDGVGTRVRLGGTRKAAAAGEDGEDGGYTEFLNLESCLGGSPRGVE